MLKLLIGFLTFVNSAYLNQANSILLRENIFLSSLLIQSKIPCHLVACRVKTFESSMTKINKNNLKDFTVLHDIIGYRLVFYNNIDLYKYYHHLQFERTITSTTNYISEPKPNGYKAFHVRYLNPYQEYEVKQFECQLYLISDYYDSVYGNSRYSKNYTLLFSI